jgi:hypothetical protein
MRRRCSEVNVPAGHGTDARPLFDSSNLEGAVQVDARLCPPTSAYLCGLGDTFDILQKRSTVDPARI